MAPRTQRSSLLCRFISSDLYQSALADVPQVRRDEDAKHAEALLDADAALVGCFLKRDGAQHAAASSQAKETLELLRGDMLAVRKQGSAATTLPLLAQLAASENRLNAARAGAAVGGESAASVQRMLGPQSGQTRTGSGDAGNGTNGDPDLDELDDLFEEFL